MYWRIFFLLIMMGWAPWGQAQSHQVYVQSFDLEQVLPNYNVRNFYQDSKGLIWLLTDEGLYAFDGHEFKAYTKEKHGLCEQSIHWIMEDDEGNIIIMASNDQHFCYSVLNPTTEEVYSLEDYASTTIPFQLNQRGMVGVNGSLGCILFKEKPTSTSPRRFYQYNIEDKSFETIFRAFPNELYDATYNISKMYRWKQDHYILKFNHTTDQFFLHVDKNGQPFHKEHCSDSSMKLGFLPNKNGLICKVCYTKNPASSSIQQIETTAQQTVNYKAPFQSQGLDSIHPFVMRQQKIYTIKNDSLLVYDLKHGFLYGAALDYTGTNNVFFVDQEGNIWLLYDNMLYIVSFSKQLFQKAFVEDKPVKIRTITVGRDSSLVVGGLNYLLCQHKTESASVEIFKRPQKGYFNIMKIYQEGRNFWAGLQQKGILHYSNSTAVPTVYTSTATISEIWSFYRATDQKLYIGGTNGIYEVDEQQHILNVWDSSGKPAHTIFHFHKGKEGVWLATNDGLYLVDLQQKRYLRKLNKEQEGKNYLPLMDLVHIHEDQAGILWLATRGDGLIAWNPKENTWEQYTHQSHGLSHDIIYGVYEDSLGYLWLPSYKGLMRFHKESKQVNIYTKKNGLPHNEFNTGAHYQDVDGLFYFGTQNGLVYFDPNHFSEATPHQATLTITSCTKTHKEDALVEEVLGELHTQQLTLLPTDKSIDITFALLYYTNIGQQQYSYRIIGQDTTWHYLDIPELSLTYLPYGKYELHLRGKVASSLDWVSYPAITIIVPKPFYLRWWFLLISGLGILCLLYGLFRWRIAQLQQKKQELETIIAQRTAKIEQQASELKALDVVKSRFFANISHELRTPLTLILAPLSYLLEEQQQQHWDEATIWKQLTTMQRNGVNLLQLVEEILQLSKLEASQLSLEEEPTPVAQFFQSLLTAFEGQFQQQELDYRLELVLEKPDLEVLLDRGKVKKIVHNFLSNALKFTPSGGRLRLNVIEETTTLHILIKDTGKGIHPDDLSFVFDRFYQSKLATQKLYGGTGIGLALVRELAELMEGKVWAESELGVGSTFHCQLPKKVVQSRREQAEEVLEHLEASPITTIGSEFTILVVEDNLDMRTFLVELLQERYKTVLWAENGQKGIEQLQKYGTSIQLIISDVMMPEMDGLTLVQQVKGNPEWQAIPLILLTALSGEQDKLAALTIGVDDYLTKPFSVAELLVRVQNLLYNYHQRLEARLEDQTNSPKAVQIAKLETTEQAVDTLEEVVLQLSSSDKAWVDSLEAWIKAQISDETPTVEALAQQACLSKRQLNRKLKSLIGFTPARFIREVQLQRARQALESGNSLSVAEVAYNSGFKAPNNFSTLFKQRFGKSPSAYFKQLQ